MRCVLLCASPEFDPLPICESDFVVACDGGADRCAELGIAPSLFVGDRDSLASSVPEGCETVLLPVEKDDTDTGCAVRLALGRGCRDFLFLGALGGRFDHTLANISTAESIARVGGRARIHGRGLDLYILSDGTLSLENGGQSHVSVFALGGKAEVSLRGLLYPLDRHVLVPSFPLGVSNAFAAPSAEIEVHSGVALVVVSA